MGLLDRLKKKRDKGREEKLERREKRKKKKDRKKGSTESAMERARKKLRDMESAGGDKGGFLKLGVGKNIVRIAGPWSGDDDEDWSVERGEHWTLDRKGNFLCPKKHGGEECAFHEAAEPHWTKLRKLKADTSDKGKAKAERYYQDNVRPLNMQTNSYVNAVLIDPKSGEPVDSDGNKVDAFLKWAPSSKVMREILALFIEDEADVCGQFWGEEGYDFIITRTGKGLQTRYGAVRATRKYLDVDTSELKVNDLSEMLGEVPSYKETKKLLSGGSSKKRDKDSDEESYGEKFDEDESSDDE